MFDVSRLSVSCLPPGKHDESSLKRLQIANLNSKDRCILCEASEEADWPENNHDV